MEIANEDFDYFLDFKDHQNYLIKQCLLKTQVINRIQN